MTAAMAQHLASRPVERPSAAHGSTLVAGERR
jgi:hypothetical protein